MATSLSAFTVAQLQRAAQIKEQIETLEAELGALLTGKAAVRRGRPPGRRVRISAAGRARIAAAQRLRWAKFKAGKGKKAGKAKGGRRKMSAAARAKIAAAQKARWARAKSQQGS